MKSTERLAQLNREKGRDLVRTLHLSELRAAGAARAVALHEAEEQLDRIARVLPDALRVGVSLTEVARSTGVSRQTLYELKTRYEPSASSELGVLEFLATAAPVMLETLVARLDQANEEVERVVASMRELGLVDVSFDPEGDGSDEYLSLSKRGIQRLEQWWEVGEGGQPA
jgi:DNA-binding MarR family transcriptional regulator